MKKKLFKIIVTILSFLLIINVFTRIVLKKYYRTTARHFASLAYIEKIKSQSQIDYLIIGDSTGLHTINSKLISGRTYNVCISGASLLDTYKTLTLFDLSRIKKGIILTNSFNSKIHYGEDFWKRFVLTNSYSIKDLSKIFNEDKTINIFPSNQFTPIEFYFTAIATKLLLNKYALEALSEYLKSLRWNVNFYQKYTLSYIANNGFTTLVDPGTKFQLKDEEFFKQYFNFYSRPFQINVTDYYYLNKIYQIASRGNLLLIMPLLPLADKATNLNVTNFKDSYESYFKNYEIHHPGFILAPIKIELKRSDFFDFNHLNSEAANKTTMALLKLLKKLKD
ncbi:MAG: hypothetical protein H7281_04505 [Bacteriovorax sp.]|nr:hypothetical protein [Bacteriovorax sp.]